MKKIYLSLIAIAIFTASCENSTENGKLDGMWQMTSVAYSTPTGYDSIINTKDSRVYLSFQRELGRITPGKLATDSMGRYIMLRFRHKGSTLEMNKFYTSREIVGPIGTEREIEEKPIEDSATTMLQPFGINGNFASFHVDKLNNSRMILTSDYARITYRKF